MRTWRTLALSASSLFIAGVFAQDTLQLADAIQLAMANEHGIRIAKNDAAIAQAQATVGNAGLLPSLDASGRANYSNQYSKLDFAPGIQDVERSGVESTTLAGHEIGGNELQSLADLMHRQRQQYQTRILHSFGQVVRGFIHGTFLLCGAFDRKILVVSHTHNTIFVRCERQSD